MDWNELIEITLTFSTFLYSTRSVFFLRVSLNSLVGRIPTSYIIGFILKKFSYFYNSLLKFFFVVNSLVIFLVSRLEFLFYYFFGILWIQIFLIHCLFLISTGNFLSKQIFEKIFHLLCLRSRNWLFSFLILFYFKIII